MNGNFNLILDKFCINNYLLSNAEKTPGQADASSV
ncbi:hypothetical protein COLAER_01947 [Collinsella aerofaciens ATCC 25986]|uniref:Uncharacterized protein n=1 Tax=Collinsella aerofaciens (strain ATCC 25986 / DSM 3979 / JCM 10188 / KCTC 3647 / NCTC 11838 / VPI 1003) TaxID=411903 RepID=A4EBW9_COLAA|nr:hypothetical protein COLAER_01947 [Collinsella aerofaciens ATCC 25986]